MLPDIVLFHQSLLSWWRVHGRILPWREKTSYQGLVISYQESAKRTVELHHGLSVREKTFELYFASKFKRDPYWVVVSEVMLQQTQVDRVVPKFTAWMEKWPTIQDLAKATLSDVLIEWKGLGYNRRARFLWAMAKEIVHQKHGVWPESEQELLKLPGVGKYTARAILSFAFGEQVGVVDTNVKRVFTRWCNVEQLGLRLCSQHEEKSKNSKSEARNSKEIRRDTKSKMKDQKENSEIRDLIETICEKELLGKSTEKLWFQLADVLLPVGADPWNQALMDFGALVCTAKNPKCEECPVSQLCAVNIWAKEHGFESFGEFVNSGDPPSFRNSELRRTKKERRKGGKDKGLKFKETDRFFRGRIIDVLREKSLTKKDLYTYLKQKFALNDVGRFDQLIRQLEKEKMVRMMGEVVVLGGE